MNLLKYSGEEHGLAVLKGLLLRKFFCGLNRLELAVVVL